MYETGTLGFKTIKKNTPAFRLDGMVMPFFINNGNNSAIINHTKIPPAGEFRVNIPFVLKGEIPILFLNDNDTGEDDTFQVNVYFGQSEIEKCP